MHPVALQVQLVSAVSEVWSGEATMVSVRSVEGDLGIMPGHAPTLVALSQGEVRIHGTDGAQTATIDGGFMSVDHDKVVIVSETVSEGSLAR